MKIEDIDKAEITISVIKQAKAQIEKYRQLKQVNEIALIANDNIFAEIKKATENGRYTKENPAPMYYTGKLKDKMLDVLIDDKMEFLNNQIKSLESL
jgi:hypothetical protein